MRNNNKYIIGGHRKFTQLSQLSDVRHWLHIGHADATIEKKNT